jgi:hypothetical protein
LLEDRLECGQAVLYALDGVVFVVDALWPRRGGEVLVGGLPAVVSCCSGTVSGAD